MIIILSNSINIASKDIYKVITAVLFGNVWSWSSISR